MSCDCGRCRQHYRTLGIAFGIPDESAIQGAYQEAVKQWHPDLYENYASLRADAEEHFKQIQIAYRELKEHNAAQEDLPEEFSVESVAVKPESTPSFSTFISFGDAPGCLVAPNFTEEAEAMIARHMGKSDSALAIIDLDGARLHPASYSHFLLLTARGLMVRDARNIVSLLWYKDLGAVNLMDKRRSGKPSLTRKLMETISGSHPKYALQIYRSNGTHFFSITDQAEDSVKEVVYDFLLRQKTQVHL